MKIKYVPFLEMVKALFMMLLCAVSMFLPACCIAFVYACFADANRGKAFMLIWCILTLCKSCIPVAIKKESYLK